jgi:glyoxylase-like metal-dependent hydrolase (beta-lactamase superfamily II)
MVFPNARYWTSRTQWEWAVDPNPREADSFLEENLLPMMDHGRIHFIDEEGEMFKGFSIRIVNGHTPGQIIPVVDYKGTKIVFGADLIPTMAHLPQNWNMSYDLDQLSTIKEKMSILREALDKQYIIFFEHDSYVECCTLQDTPKGIREDRTMALAEI